MEIDTFEELHVSKEEVEWGQPLARNKISSRPGGGRWNFGNIGSWIRQGLMGLFCVLFMFGQGLAAEITLAWDPNTEPDLVKV